jgi:glycosyltransferase involved in cell wall biosynthesis
VTTTERLPCFVAANDDPFDHRTLSGIPFHLLDAGLAAGLVDGALPTTTGPGYNLRRIPWHLRRRLQPSRRGTFLISSEGIRAVWRKVEIPEPCRILNCFQLYPPSVLDDSRIRRWFFIDQTLHQLFDGHSLGRRVAPRMAREVRALEQLGYERAEGFIVPSQWAARGLRDEYGVDAEKVHVIPQSANLDVSLVRDWWTARPTARPNDALRLVFVGIEAWRKGLDRLIDGFRIARDRGSEVELTVIGCERSAVPRNLRTVAGIAWLGFMDKIRDQQRFIEIVGNHDVGCWLSRHEAAGVGLREYHALGLAILGTTVGGAPEMTLPEASVLVSPQASIEAVAECLMELAGDRDRVQRMKEHAGQQRETMLWPASIAALRAFWPTD